MSVPPREASRLARSFDAFGRDQGAAGVKQVRHVIFNNGDHLFID